MPRKTTAQQTYFGAWIKQHGLPPPTNEHPFHPSRGWRFDFAWPAFRVALEVEGGIFGGTDPKTGRKFKGAHSSVGGILRDIEKYNEGVAHGWRILRTPPDRLFSDTTVDLLRRTLK